MAPFPDRPAIQRRRSSLVLISATVLLIAPIAPPRLLADSVGTNTRAVTRLAEGVYEIRHKDAPDHFPQGNTTVIIGDNGVLVVDSCYLPSSAREDIVQIHQWTNKPVRYLVNTHWHGDHTQGNAVYSDAFAGLTIVAQTSTARLMALRVPSYLADYPHRMERFQQQLDRGRDSSGRSLTEEEKQDLRNAVAGGKAASDAVSAEFINLKARTPDMTFDHELAVNLGHREVQLKFLGPGNTLGDAVAYLPKEKIVIAGDLVDSPVPYFGSGFPNEQIVTLKRLAELDFETLVPGHGEVLQGKNFLRQEIAFLEAVVGAMNDEIGRTSDLPERRLEAIKKAVEQHVDVNAWRQTFAGDNAGERDFFDSFTWPGLIEAALAEMWPR